MDSINNQMLGQTLTLPEIECLRLRAAGKSSSEIAADKQLSEFSVSYYLKSARQKLQTKNISHAISVACKSGLI